MSLNVIINYNSEINELCSMYPVFNFLKSTRLHESEDIKWNISGIESYDAQVMFIGKTGYGKSTTLNKIIGKDLFETSDTSSCTKQLFSAEYKLNNNQYFSFNDLPGVGESKLADTQYYEWYKGMLDKSYCVVYLLRADQRDYTVDQVLFKEMFKNLNERKKVIVALNFADKIEPINRTSELTTAQLANLNKKVEEVKKLFEVKEVIYYSAALGLNIDILTEKIASVVRKVVYK